MRAYHGTSTTVASTISSGRPIRQRRVFQAANRSLGGTYVTRRPELAAVYAETAAGALGGRPIVLVVDVPTSVLLPDEDWVVNVAEGRSPSSRRVETFLDDLFRGYLGEGHSLSDHYKTRYNELNDAHGITWRDSWSRNGTARLERGLHRDEIHGVCIPSSNRRRSDDTMARRIP